MTNGYFPRHNTIDVFLLSLLKIKLSVLSPQKYVREKACITYYAMSYKVYTWKIMRRFSVLGQKCEVFLFV